LSLGALLLEEDSRLSYSQTESADGVFALEEDSRLSYSQTESADGIFARNDSDWSVGRAESFYRRLSS